MKNKTLFSEHMAALCEIFDREISETMSRVYWKILEPYSDEECKKAFSSIITTSKFWPKPAEFLEVLNGTENEAATKAWLKVDRAVKSLGTYRSVCFDDPAIHSTLEAMGGWINLPDDKPGEWKWKQREFEKLYPLMVKKSAHPDHLPGIVEQSNLERGFEEFVLEPVRVRELPSGTIMLEEKRRPKLVAVKAGIGAN